MRCEDRQAPRRSRIAGWVLASATLAGGLSCSQNKPAEPPPAQATRTADSPPEVSTTSPLGAATGEPKPLPVLFSAPQFQLTDQAGATFGTKELSGKVWVVNFMFTHCTATCPAQTAKFADLQRRGQRWPDWDRVRLLSITVDPKRDTVARLREYADQHAAADTHWKFLTGSREELVRISKEGFKLPVSDAEATPIAHSQQFLLIDARQQVRGVYDGLSDLDFSRLLVDIRGLLAEAAPGLKEPLHVGSPAQVFDPVWMEGRKAAQLAARKDITVENDFEFVDRVEASGITFISRVVPDAGRDYKANHYDHGTGLAAADVDGDGLHDLYFVSQVGGNELWRNLGGGRFENITPQAGVALAGRVCVTASFADIDNDGDADLFVTSVRHGNAMFENEGKGRFKDITSEAGLDYKGHSSSGDFFDYDRDGRLDLLLTNVGKFTTDEVGYSGDPDRKEHPYYVGLKAAFAGHLYPELDERSILYRNEGENRFRDVTAEVGLVADTWSGDATPIDVNDDGWMDVYLLNMQGNDVCFQNVDGKSFQRVPMLRGSRGVWGGMGVKAFDYNNNGLVDLFITNMHADMLVPEKTMDVAAWTKKAPVDQIPASFLRSRDEAQNRLPSILGNCLYHNEGDGTFRDVSVAVNAETFWPWGPSVGDLNADGYQDILVTACMNYNFRYHFNSLLLNDRGKTFRDAEFILGIEPRRGGQTAASWFELDCSGADAEHALCKGRTGKVVAWGAIGSRSAAIFDLDRDGDLDIVTNDSNTLPMVLISNLAERKTSLSHLEIELQGTRSNRDGLGAKVQVTVGDRTLLQFQDGQSGYLSQSRLPLYFGLGGAKVADKIEIRWPSGERQVLDGPIESNQRLSIVEPAEGSRER